MGTFNFSRNAECRASFEILDFVMKASLTKAEIFIFYLIS